MIFLKEKDVMRSQTLQERLKKIHHEKIGNYYLVHPPLPVQYSETSLP